MICPKCGFENYDGVQICVNCRKKLKIKNKDKVTNKQETPQQTVTNPEQPQNGSSQTIVNDIIPDEVVVDYSNIKVPKKKLNPKPIFAVFLVLFLICVAAGLYYEYKMALWEAQGNAKPKPTPTPTVAVTEKPTPTEEPTIEVTPEITIEITPEIDIAKEFIDKFYAGENNYNKFDVDNGIYVAIPIVEAEDVSNIYEVSAYAFWNNTKLSIAKVESEDNSLDTIYTTSIEPYVETWNFASDTVGVRTTNVNGKNIYYVEGKQVDITGEVEDTFARCYYIPSQNLGYSIIEITYGKDDYQYVKQLYKIIEQNFE